MIIKVEFPKLLNQVMDCKAVGDVKRFGLAAAELKYTLVLISKVTVTGILSDVRANKLANEYALHLEYTETYNPDDTFASFMNRAEKYACEVISNIKAAK